MNIASRLRLCALPLAVSLALAACSGSSTPPDGHKAAEPPAATAAADTALPQAGSAWPVPRCRMVHDQKAVLLTRVHSDDGADIEVTDTRRIVAATTSSR